MKSTLDRTALNRAAWAGLAGLAGLAGVIAMLSMSAAQAQTPSAERGGGGRAPPEYWYINKGKGGVYTPPNKPLWKMADLLKMHAGQNNWSQQIIKDNLQDVTYNSAAPGTKVIPRMHMETATAFVIIKGEVHFTVEGQAPVTATRGGIVNIMGNTIYSYDVEGASNALWVEIHPLWYQTEYPASEPPPPAITGTDVVKVAYAHKPTPYAGANKLYFNLFDAIANCQPVANVVTDEHIFVNPLLGWVNPADNKCPNAVRGNVGGPGAPGAFNPQSTFGHLHHGVIEWWVVQSGAISGKFENTGEFHAVEGDVLYAAPDMWHQMAAEAPSGPSVRTAMSGYNIVNMANTSGAP